MTFWPTVAASVLAGVMGVVLGAFLEPVKVWIRRWPDKVRRLFQKLRYWWLEYKDSAAKKKQARRMEECARSGGHDIGARGNTLGCFKGCGYSETCSHTDDTEALTENAVVFYHIDGFTRQYIGYLLHPGMSEMFVSVCQQCRDILGIWRQCVLCGAQGAIEPRNISDWNSDYLARYQDVIKKAIGTWRFPLCKDSVGCKDRTSKFAGRPESVIQDQIKKRLDWVLGMLPKGED